MTWLQRYRVRTFLRFSMWLVPLTGMVAALIVDIGGTIDEQAPRLGPQEEEKTYNSRPDPFSPIAAGAANDRISAFQKDNRWIVQ